MKTKRKKKQPPKGCMACREQRENNQAYGVGLLLVTVAGCGLPGLVTIPWMIYTVYMSSRPCPACRKRQAKQKETAIIKRAS